MLRGIQRIRAIQSRLGGSRLDYARVIAWLIAFVILIPKLGLVTTCAIFVAAAGFELVLTRPDLLVQVGWFVPILVFLGVALTVPSNIDSLTFYQTSAETASVLFVVLAIEVRAFRLTSRPREARRAPALTALVLFGAGVEAMRVLASGRPQDGHFYIVAGGLAAAAVSLAITALIGFPFDDRDDRAAPRGLTDVVTPPAP